jgi:hypothetical protein
MPLPPKKSDQELYALCREIYERDGDVTANRLRDAAGGGGYNRLKAIVEAWTQRRADEVARSAKAARSRRRRDDAPSARADTSALSEDTVTLAQAEQEAIQAEEARVAEALAGGRAEPTETPEPTEPVAVAEATPAEAAGLPVTPAALDPAEAVAPLESSAEPESEPMTPVRPAIPRGGAEDLSRMSLQAENARLQAHVEDLRRENERLWEQVREERRARIQEIELLNGLITSFRPPRGLPAEGS